MPFTLKNRIAKLSDIQLGSGQLVLLATLAFICVVNGTSFVCADDAAPSPYATSLREHGIEPNAKGLSKYLRLLYPNEKQRLEAEKLVKQLGNERFSERRSAMRLLLALPMPPIEALNIAARSQDLEVRKRASKILAVVKPQRLMLMFAIFKTVEREKFSGLTADLLRVVSLCDQRYLKIAVRKAVRATARPDDAIYLRKAIADQDQEVVIAAIGGLRVSLGTDAQDDLRALLEHTSEEISLAAAWELADLGDRISLARLVKLLDASNLQVRVGAVKTLRAVSNTRHKYWVYEKASVRKQAIERWAAWVEGEGRTAKLHFPLKKVRVELGLTLISNHQKNKVIELDASGKQVWEKTGLNKPWGGIGLSNGNRLIACYNDRYLVEYDASGKEIWRKNGLPAHPFNVRRLDNGNTLVACSDSNKVIEFRPDGSTAWEITIKGRPMDVRRLDNGRNLIALYSGKRVQEVDRDGKVHWEIKGLKDPVTAQRLENGNTLVSEYTGSRVSEWDRAGKLVWQYKGLQSPLSAERLANGNTLIAHGRDVREVDHQGKIVWQKKMTGAAHAYRY